MCSTQNKVNPVDINKDFEKTAFFVEATDFERHALWELFSNKLKKVTQWDNLSGCLISVGKLGKHDICVCFTFVKIDGVIICFYEAISNVVDHAMVESWIEENCTIPKYDGRRGMTNAMNFHHAYEQIVALRTK